MRNEYQEKHTESARIAKEVDGLIAHALTGSRPVGELDSRATTLMVVSITLLAISLLKSAPKEIEILGFKFESVDWIVMVLPISAMVIYLAAHLIMQWWSEKHLWQVATGPSIIDSRDRIQELLKRHDMSQSDWLQSVLVFQKYSLSDEYIIPELLEYPHPDFNFASPEVVKTALDNKIDTEYKKMKAMGIFRHIPEDKWKASMGIVLNYEIRRAELMQSGTDEDREKLRIEKINKNAELKKNAIHSKDANADEELHFNKKVVDYCIIGLNRIKTIIRINAIRLWTVLVIPVSLAIVALCTMITEVLIRYPIRY